MEIIIQKLWEQICNLSVHTWSLNFLKIHLQLRKVYFSPYIPSNYVLILRVVKLSVICQFSVTTADDRKKEPKHLHPTLHRQMSSFQRMLL
jgi:hypothetical protein